MDTPEGLVGLGREAKQHEMTITKTFGLSRSAVTLNEYDHFCQATGRQKPGDAGWGRGRRPVIHVRCGCLLCLAQPNDGSLLSAVFAAFS